MFKCGVLMGNRAQLVMLDVARYKSALGKMQTDQRLVLRTKAIRRAEQTSSRHLGSKAVK